MLEYRNPVNVIASGASISCNDRRVDNVPATGVAGPPLAYCHTDPWLANAGNAESRSRDRETMIMKEGGGWKVNKEMAY